MDWSTLNVVWTLIAFVGTLASLRALYSAINDHRFIVSEEIEHTAMGRKRFRNRFLVSQMTVISEMSRLMTLMFFFGLGCLAITTPPPSRILNNIIIGLFIIVEVTLAGTSILINFYRKVVFETGDGDGTVV